MKTSAAARNAGLDAECDLLNNGYLRIYGGGSGEPSTPETAVTDQTLLAELRFGNPAFAAASSGSKTANAITGDADGNADGVAAWFRALKSDGTTVVHQGSVGTSGKDLNLDSVAIRQHADVEVSSYVVTRPQGSSS